MKYKVVNNIYIAENMITIPWVQAKCAELQVPSHFLGAS